MSYEFDHAAFASVLFNIAVENNLLEEVLDRDLDLCADAQMNGKNIPISEFMKVHSGPEAQINFSENILGDYLTPKMAGWIASAIQARSIPSIAHIACAKAAEYVFKNDVHISFWLYTLHTLRFIDKMWARYTNEVDDNGVPLNKEPTMRVI